MSTKLSFTSKLKFLEVDIDGKEYILSEISGAQREVFLTKQSARMRFDAKGNVQGLRDFTGFESNLVSLSLKDKETGKCVEVSVIETWPASVVMQLAKEARKISGMASPGEAEETEQPKNDSAASE
jgi:hypothetical protein